MSIPTQGSGSAADLTLTAYHGMLDNAAAWRLA